MKNPTVSIIVPVYNTGRYLRTCLCSVARQTLGDVEVVIVDDGSTDGSTSICDEFGMRYGWTVIHQQNQGLSIARNVGIDHANGNYLLFVDSDDHIAPSLCEEVCKYASETGADLVRFFYCEDTKIGMRELKSQYRLPEGRIDTDVDRLRCAYAAGPMVWKFLIKRDILTPELRFVAGAVYEDMDFTARLALLSRNMHVYHECLYRYRIRKSSLSWTRPNNVKEQCASCCDKGIAFAIRSGASLDAVEFLKDRKSKMLSVLDLRAGGCKNDEYPEEVYYE